MSGLLFFLPDTDLIQAEPSEHFSDPEPLPRIRKNLMIFRTVQKLVFWDLKIKKSNKIEWWGLRIALGSTKQPELGTLEWWISRSILDPLCFLISRLT